MQLPFSSQCLCFESYWPVCTLLKSPCVWRWSKLRHSSFLHKSILFLVPFLYVHQERKRKWTVWMCWSQRWMFLFWIDQNCVKYWPLGTPLCLHSPKSALDIWKPFDCVGNACNNMTRGKTAIVVPSVCPSVCLWPIEQCSLNPACCCKSGGMEHRRAWRKKKERDLLQSYLLPRVIGLLPISSFSHISTQ